MLPIPVVSLSVGFFLYLECSLWHLKCSLGEPTHSSQGLHILREIRGAEGGFDWLVRAGDEGILFTKGNFVILESCEFFKLFWDCQM